MAWNITKLADTEHHCQVDRHGTPSQNGLTWNIITKVADTEQRYQVGRHGVPSLNRLTWDVITRLADTEHRYQVGRHGAPSQNGLTWRTPLPGGQTRDTITKQAGMGFFNQIS